MLFRLRGVVIRSKVGVLLKCMNAYVICFFYTNFFFLCRVCLLWIRRITYMISFQLAHVHTCALSFLKGVFLISKQCNIISTFRELLKLIPNTVELVYFVSLKHTNIFVLIKFSCINHCLVIKVLKESSPESPFNFFRIPFIKLPTLTTCVFIR